MNQEFYGQESVQHRGGVLFLLLVLGSYCWLNTALAAEVYTWKDKEGVTHFSDLPPLTGDARLMQVQDLYSPGSSGAYPVAENDGEDTASADDNPMTENPASLAQQRREQLAMNRKEQREKKAETAEMCEKYRQLLARIEPARRVYYTNEKGQEVRMDDAERVGRIEESKDYIAKNCK